MPEGEPKPSSSVPLKVLGACAALLLVGILYNSAAGWNAESGAAQSMRPAALPLQRRPRHSRFVDDPDNPFVVFAHGDPKMRARALAARANKTDALRRSMRRMAAHLAELRRDAQVQARDGAGIAKHAPPQRRAAPAAAAAA